MLPPRCRPSTFVAFRDHCDDVGANQSCCEACRPRHRAAALFVDRTKHVIDHRAALDGPAKRIAGAGRLVALAAGRCAAAPLPLDGGGRRARTGRRPGGHGAHLRGPHERRREAHQARERDHALVVAAHARDGGALQVERVRVGPRQARRRRHGRLRRRRVHLRAPLVHAAFRVRAPERRRASSRDAHEPARAADDARLFRGGHRAPADDLAALRELRGQGHALLRHEVRLPRRKGRGPLRRGVTVAVARRLAKLSAAATAATPSSGPGTRAETAARGRGARGAGVGVEDVGGVRRNGALRRRALFVAVLAYTSALVGVLPWLSPRLPSLFSLPSIPP